MIEAIANAIAKVAELFTWIFKRKGSGDAFGTIVSIYDAMQEALSHHPIHRFLILRSENGGGLINAGSPIYTSVLYETYKDPLGSIRQDFQRIEVDKAYMNILWNAYKNAFVKTKTEDLDDHSQLKNAYLSYGIKYSEVYFIKHTTKAFFYLSVVTIDDDQQFDDPELRNAIDISVNKIRNLMKK